jgi:hypothetical protein
MNITVEGNYRVKEYNDIYDCGWIFVSNIVSFEWRLKHKQLQSPHLSFSIVPV